jgi:formyl-CoA transferase
MGRPELARDPRYVDHVSRGRHQVELDDLIADWTRVRSVAEVEAAMLAHSVPAGTIYRAPEMLADPHFAAREALVAVDTARWGRIHMQNSFPKLSDTPSSVRTPAPATVGQHNSEVYGDLLGLDAEALAGLAETGAI